MSDGGGPSADDPRIRSAVRRVVGIAALRRIRRLVDADAAHEAAKRVWARRIGVGLGLAVLLAVAWLVVVRC